MAEKQEISINKLVEEWANVALAQHDLEARFQAMAVQGNARRGIALLDKLDRAFARNIDQKVVGRIAFAVKSLTSKELFLAPFQGLEEVRSTTEAAREECWVETEPFLRRLGSLLRRTSDSTTDRAEAPMHLLPIPSESC